MSIQMFFFLFLFSGYFLCTEACVICIVSAHCNQSSFAFFNVVFDSLYWCMDSIFYAGDPSSSFIIIIITIIVSFFISESRLIFNIIYQASIIQKICLSFSHSPCCCIKLSNCYLFSFNIFKFSLMMIFVVAFMEQWVFSFMKPLTECCRLFNVFFFSSFVEILS